VINPVGKVTSFEVVPVDDMGLQAMQKYLKSSAGVVDVDDVDIVRVGWSFTGNLKLPWNPVLGIHSKQRSTNW